MRVISSIKWTDKSITHIARHAIRPREVEEVCFSENDAPFIRSGRENLHYVFGRTYSGRFLFIVVRFIRQGEVNEMKKIPKFKTDEEAARFWETHSFEDYNRDTKEAEIGFVKRPKKTIAIRLDPDDIKKVEAIAERMGLSYTALLRMWIKEHLAKESRHIA